MSKVDWGIRFANPVFDIQTMYRVGGASLFGVSMHLDSVQTKTTKLWL